MTDYSDYAMFKQAMDAYGDPGFARWLCENYPWGGVDLGRTRAQYLKAGDNPGNRNPATGYYAAVAAEGEKLGERLTAIRQQQDAGELTSRVAADQRITAMEQHLAACQALREQYFGRSES